MPQSHRSQLKVPDSFSNLILLCPLRSTITLMLQWLRLALGRCWPSFQEAGLGSHRSSLLTSVLTLDL